MSKSSDPDLQLLAAAADPIRLRMIRQLALGDAVCACDFATDATVSQPTISHHLRVLREAGWVTTERRGTWIWYSLNPAAAEKFRRVADLGASRRLPVVEHAGR
jgi:ArsR family transcriptional regulator